MAAIHTRTPALPAVPPALAARGVSLRAEQSADGAFLARLYVSTRWEELQPTGWSDEQKVGFLLQQFTLQTAHYSC
jgi:hypothetical protein